MIHELVYTSAKGRTLAGDHTVATTPGLPHTQRLMLEQLTSYTPFFQLSDPRASQNPVNYAHSIFSDEGTEFHILSRIVFSGADHTGRSNRIAHHFLLSPSEVETVKLGPAHLIQQILKQEQFHLSWPTIMDQDTTELPVKSPEIFVNSEPSPSQAINWYRLTGKAGWAGLLADAFRTNKQIPSYIIYSLGTDILSLFAESLDLLSPEERWQVQFSTYFNTNLVGHHYHWRGVLAGSEAIREINRFPDARVIDLTTKSTKPLSSNGKFTSIAKNGKGELLEQIERLTKENQQHIGEKNKFKADNEILGTELCNIKQNRNSLAEKCKQFENELSKAKGNTDDWRQKYFDKNNELKKTVDANNMTLTRFGETENKLARLQKTNDKNKIKERFVVRLLIGLISVVIGIGIGYFGKSYLDMRENGDSSQTKISTTQSTSRAKQ